MTATIINTNAPLGEADLISLAIDLEQSVAVTFSGPKQSHGCCLGSGNIPKKRGCRFYVTEELQLVLEREEKAAFIKDLAWFSRMQITFPSRYGLGGKTCIDWYKNEKGMLVRSKNEAWA